MLLCTATLFAISYLFQLSACLLIDKNLLNIAENEGAVDTFVQFAPFDFGTRVGRRVVNFLEKRQVDRAFVGLQEFPSPNTPTREQLERGYRRRKVKELLKSHAAKSQESTIRELQKLGLEVRSFWINNSILIRKVPSIHLTLIVSLVTNEESGHNILSIFPNRLVARIPPIPKVDETMLPRNHSVWTTRAHNRDEASLLWNIRLINADKVWEKTRGEGVVVASLDTGVDFLHPLLHDQYRGFDRIDGKVNHAYNWYDPEGKVPLPADFHGHGTHTMGTIVGKKVGIASASKWIAAQGCDVRGCSQERLLASAEWVMCPTDENGENARCELGADIVNNSWGGEITDEESMTWYSGAVDAWLAAGMWPIFAQGNSGPACGTVGTPGDLESVIGVGAVDENGALAVFSSRGPGGSRLGHSPFKPDYVAPGQDIISCKPGGEIVAMSGTSMAAPHISGVAALLLSLRASLQFDEFRKILTRTVNTSFLKEPQKGQLQCYGKRWDAFPNYHYGFGLIDAHAAAQLVLKESVESH